MKRLVEVEEICPFIGKPCIRDGWQWDRKIAHPCAFWDGDRLPYTDPAIEPCRIKRGLNKILAEENSELSTDTDLEVPWGSDEKGDGSK